MSCGSPPWVVVASPEPSPQWISCQWQVPWGSVHGGSHPGESSRALCSFSFCPLRGTEFLQTHHLPVVRRACCLVYRVFAMCPRYTSQQDFDIRHCRLHGLLLPQKDPKRIAQTLRETSIRDRSLRLTVVLILFHRWCRWCTEQGSNLPKVKCWTVDRARHKNKNTRSPDLTIITGSPFIAFRACWMPCTD